ncbi:Toll/interleukin-1 receptor domain-containing protein [Tanacetum coccineum]|uniref:Toll/interleukin-1 receptor domain-containing protein n=1 Tax=Tanacetum coccineum TaxID=301880 RepID=A0ABQ4XK99_9ASTR
MASSSTSFSQKSFKYDVFLSFRGQDTRKRITDELIEAIQDLKLYIIVFSKKYASSSWCLDELVKIMECQKMTEHTAYPVFYDVQPTQVQKQSGPIKKAFAKIKKKEAAGKWTQAMKEASSLVGWELKNTLDGVDKKLIGMETRVQGVVSSLKTSVGDVHTIGIKGMGGAGKTTLAKAVYDQISFQFEGQSFVENVREVSKASLSGLKDLQKEILSDVLNDQSITVSSVHEGKKMMHGRKVLIVLDDVDKIEQLEALVSEHNWFKPGSTIIITIRDMQVLVAHGVEMIYGVNLLSDEEANYLFSRYAFGREILVQGYEELSGQAMRYAKSLITISIYGRLEMHDHIEEMGRNIVRRLHPDKPYRYSRLWIDKEIEYILANDLGTQETKCIKLDAGGFNTQILMKGLTNMKELGFLDLYTTPPVSEDASNGSIWNFDEVSVYLPNALRNMVQLWEDGEEKACLKLRFLKFTYSKLRTLDLSVALNLETVILENCYDLVEVHFQVTPNLKELRIYDCNRLEKLHMPVESPKLISLDLNDSKLTNLHLGITPNLEELFIECCYNLVELHMPSESPRIGHLDLGCSKLMSLYLGITPNLETLRLNMCTDMVELQIPTECPKLVNLDLINLKLITLHLGITPNLETLRVYSCIDMAELHMPAECPKLVNLDLSNLKLMTLHLGWYQELKFLIKMSPRRSEGEESEYPFFKGDGSSSNEWGDYGLAGDDYEGPPVFDDDQYEEESMLFYDTDIEDVIEEEEGFIRKGGFGGEEDNIEDVVVVANDLCSSIIQTNLNVNFEEDVNTKSHELMSLEKSNIIRLAKVRSNF